jgi:REP element-mobilizing transposase RayT
MSDRFQNKYRIPSARLKNWDYGRNAAYFVTICTQNRISWFGEMQMDTDAMLCVSLSPIGQIAQTEWIKTFKMRPDMNLQMGEYVIMPNHFHAIIIIGENEYNVKRGKQQRRDGPGRLDLAQRRDAMHCVSTTKTDINDTHRTDAMHCVSTTKTDTNDTHRTDAMHCVSAPSPPQNQFGPQSKNLASIIRGFKTGVTKNARLIHPDFAWQSRFHDRIIRNNAEFQRISTYIRNNPANWQNDKFFN